MALNPDKRIMAIVKKRSQSRGVLPALSFLRMQESPFQCTVEGNPCMRKGDSIL